MSLKDADSIIEWGEGSNFVSLKYSDAWFTIPIRDYSWTRHKLKLKLPFNDSV